MNKTAHPDEDGQRPAPLPERIERAIHAYGMSIDSIKCSTARMRLDEAITEVVAERDSWMHSANILANEAQQLRADLAAAQAKLAEVDRKRL